MTEVTLLTNLNKYEIINWKVDYQISSYFLLHMNESTLQNCTKNNLADRFKYLGDYS